MGVLIDQMKIPYYHVDAFSDKVFAGNPAGVCLLESWPADSLLQHIAAENNLPETAFVVPHRDHYTLRWFTPLLEIDLCGHATLATAFVLDKTVTDHVWPIQFVTRSGILEVAKRNDLFIMDLPSRPALPCDIPAPLIHGLGATPGKVYKCRDYLCIFDHEDQVSTLSPDFHTLASLDCLGVIASAPGENVDFVSRFFAPQAGIPEDPVTGSSHCTLIPYWARRTGKQKLIARQLSARGGELFCENNDERVLVGGKAVLYHSTMLRI
ncbi:MAG: PhzF family phenazine biosynthesis protein [Desulfobulbales bacterium]